MWSLYKGLKNAFNSVLGYLGLFNKNAKIVFLGLDNAGKTALLSVLKSGRITQTKPTGQPTAEEFKIGNLRISAHDLGGHETARKIWGEYYHGIDGILFLVDSVDVQRFPEAKKELEGILNSNELSNVPVAILGNKIDMEGAVSEQELKDALAYDELVANQNRPMELFMVSVAKKVGYSKALEWMTTNLPD